MSNVLTSSMHIELTTQQHNTRNGSIGAKSIVKLHVLSLCLLIKEKELFIQYNYSLCFLLCFVRLRKKISGI